MRFLGNIEAKTDSKGRVFLPATFRKILQASGEESLVMRKDIHQQCLVLYPESVWNERVDALRERISDWDEEGMMVLRQYMKEAEIVVLDGNGRFLIPRRYLQMAAINQTVRFIGMTKTIEIWAAEKAEQPFMEQKDFSTKMQAIMAPKKTE
jgi:MraZ protein